MSRTSSKSPAADSAASARGTRIFLGLSCFLAGAAMMVIEICAYRLLAPFFGNSVYTWTALIGVILIAFSAGGYLGGHLADRKMALDLLGWLLAGSAVLTFFIPALHTVFAVSLSASGLIAGPVTISLLLFAIPGVLLGAVSPAAVRFYSLTLKDTHVGAAAGTISMLGSLGSFVGTFLSGFFLLSTFGVRSIFFGTASLLLVLAVAAFFLAKNTLKQQAPVILSGIFAFAMSWMTVPKPKPGVIYEHESFYHHIEVSEQTEGKVTRRVLQLDSTMEGGMDANTGDLILPYQEYWKLALLREPAKVGSALFIGAGAFGMPENVSRDFPEAVVDVVEIDPHVIEVGRRFFKLDEHPRVKAHAGDARRYLLQNNGKKWDLIFGDAYNGIRQIPPHLATREFYQQIADHLEPKGVFIMNLIASVTGPKSELTSGMLATVRQVFPHVEIFSIGYRRDETQNVILMCSREDLKPLIADRYVTPGSWQERLIRTHVPAGTVPRSAYVFTDDHNPVDAIIARGLLE
ncbi:fused MFS/spermidine synthase [Prosthecobacter sp.]|uniref:fused MFS/spermidine synthase n=1 Tax=Prosthecobacter sp. TaxID=1965333 RepID=UPI002ABC77DC|nr:fused MFS/spermidine synthase [Prosthecobacter sp.]MDZ4404274.1 fused MFS/spermidine synthase [Prosthecobacter sp.]